MELLFAGLRASQRRTLHALFIAVVVRETKGGVRRGRCAVTLRSANDSTPSMHSGGV